ncbi:transcriptional regulator, GntR family [Methylobacterium sp. 4-46]|uniref:GntR family transcriptional regulator n=1 Tax=unclassified Methylobacterium TaxID=2615210 RepID=UPI000152CBBC|nr:MULTISPECIES: GntR family transcriptional regulator [Methylobacterium]ACA18407.1 transcriptional regulator, GntR family [Methylobacterium sp. 4-46]WFT77696.1 GntR family transcriptional regulator [Methylobacterium nodulans]
MTRGSAPARPAPSLTEHAAAELRRLILLNRLRPGEALNEPDLARRLGISRTPIREALKLLAGEGLVTLRRNRAALVSRLDPAGLVPLFELEAALESYGAGLAAERMSEGDLARLARLQEAMEALREDRDAYVRLNRQAHRLIVAAARSPAVAEAHERAFVRLERARNLALDTGGRLDESLAEHRAILAALRARDAEAARLLMARHVARTQALLVARLAEGEGRAPEADGASGPSR